MPYRGSIFVALATAVGALGCLTVRLSAGSPEPERVDFDHQIAPILLRHCSGCHNPSECSGGLNLLSASTAFSGGKSGEPAIKPGDLDNSYAVTRIEAGEMPPPGKGKPLAAEEFAAFKHWIESGATWPKDRTLDQFELTTETRAGRDWWSLKPPVRPPLPHVKDASWVRTPIDAFVLAKLEEHGLRPAPEADRTTLIRRATFDLARPAADARGDRCVRRRSIARRLRAARRSAARLAAIRRALGAALARRGPLRRERRLRERIWRGRMPGPIATMSSNRSTPTSRTRSSSSSSWPAIRSAADVGDRLSRRRAARRVKSPDEELTRMQRLDDLDDMISATTTAFLGLTVGCAHATITSSTRSRSATTIRWPPSSPACNMASGN